MNENIAAGLQPLAVTISTLTPDAANARRHSQRNLEAIAASLTRFGQRTPLVVRRDGMVVLKGNGTLEAAKAMGWTRIAAIVVDDPSAEGIAYAIADNRSAELAEWDDETLAALLQGMDDDLRDVAGFTDAELDAVMKGLEPDGAESSDSDSSRQVGDAIEFRLIVVCGSENKQAELMERLESEGYECKPLMS